MKLLVLGAGYSGLAIARAALAHGASVAGTARSADKVESLRAAGLDGLRFDGTPDAALMDRLAQTTHLVVCAPPGEDGDPLLSALTPDAPMPALRWIGYLSTVGVYGDHGGAWVDEETPCRPGNARSTRRLEAERGWLAMGAEAGVPVALLRLSGIYGPGRNALVNLAEGKARRIVKPGQVFNRIHVDDIAGAATLLAGQGLSGIFNVTDDLPAPPQDVVAFAAETMGVAPPPEKDFETAGLGQMARSFYGENKRVSNARLKAAGYRFRHPDYRAAISTMWRDGTWRGAAD